MSFFTKLFNGYQQLLLNYPVRTQCISTGVIMGSGDVLAQMIVEKQDKWDPVRTIKFAGIGALAVGPLLNFWLAFLDKLYKGKSTTRIVKMVITDQSIMAPTIVGIVIGGSTFTRNWSVEETKQGLSSSFFPALKINYMIWPATQFINFTFVPVHFRLFVINFVALFWNSFLSYTSQKSKTPAITEVEAEVKAD